MYESFTAALQRWNQIKTERQKLQTVYLVAGLAIILFAGLVTFINATLGYNLLTIGAISLGIFALNGVVWHLTASAFLSRVKSKPRNK